MRWFLYSGAMMFGFPFLFGVWLMWPTPEGEGMILWQRVLIGVFSVLLLPWLCAPLIAGVLRMESNGAAMLLMGLFAACGAGIGILLLGALPTGAAGWIFVFFTGSVTMLYGWGVSEWLSERL